MFSNHVSDEIPKSDSSSLLFANYSNLFREETSVPENHFDSSFLNVLDIAAAEEGILHVLHATASQPQLSCKLTETSSDMWSILPLVQALLPALRPPFSFGPTEQVDDSFSQWNHPDVHKALSQVFVTADWHHLPFLKVFVTADCDNAKVACVLLDLCTGPLSPWVPMITSKIDLAVELLEDLLGFIQGVGQSLVCSRAALKYVVLAISGNMDDILTEYKEVKHKLLFILEMLDPFIDHAISAMEDTISFGGVSAMNLEKQAKACDLALNIIRTAAKNPAVLPSLELEWRRGAVAPSVLLSILDPHMPLPPDVDLCKSSMPKVDQAALAVSNYPALHSCDPEDVERQDVSETTARVESFEQCNYLFAPEELKQTDLTNALQGEGHDRITRNLNQNIPEGRKNKIKLPAGLFQLDNTAAAD